MCADCQAARQVSPAELLAHHDPGEPWLKWSCPIQGCGHRVIGPWELEEHAAAEHPGWVARYELVRPYPNQLQRVVYRQGRGPGWLIGRRRPGPGRRAGLSGADAGAGAETPARRVPDSRSAPRSRRGPRSVPAASCDPLAGGRCCAGSCHSGQTVGAVGAAAPPPTTTAARGATPSKGQAPGLLVARLRRTLRTWRPGPWLGPRPGGQGSGCRLGRWCLSVPHLRRNWEGVGSTVAPAPAVVPRAEGGRVRGGPGPQPVPGRSKRVLAPARAMVRASRSPYLLRGRLAGCSSPEPGGRWRRTRPGPAVLAQADVDDTTNEITQFQPLLERLDLAGQVVTADALHTQHTHADWLVSVKHAPYLLIVKANQPTLHQQLKALPWRELPVADHPGPQPPPRGGPPADDPARAAGRQPPSAVCVRGPPPDDALPAGRDGPCRRLAGAVFPARRAARSRAAAILRSE